MWAEKPGRENCKSRAAPVPGSKRYFALVSERLPAAQQASSSSFAVGPSLAPACCWFQMCFGRESTGPDGFCSLLSSVSLPTPHFTAAAQRQGSQGGPAKYLDLATSPRPPPALERSEVTGAESQRLRSAVVPAGQVPVAAESSHSPPSSPSPFSPLCLQSIHRTIFEVFEIWAS